MQYRALFDNAQALSVIAREMHVTGMPVDEERRAAHRTRLIKERDDAETAFRAVAGYDGAMGNDDKVAALFFGEGSCYALKPVKLTATGRPCIDKGVLQSLLNCPVPEAKTAAEHLLTFRQASTTESRYIGQGFAGEEGAYGLPVLRATGRHHPTFGVCAAETLRFTCQGGAQQIQRPTLAEVVKPDGTTEIRVVRPGTRDIFVAPPGWLWIEADYAQLEPRLFTLYAGIKEWDDCFRGGRDFYKTNASFCLSKPYETIFKQEREVIKKCILGGIAYGGTAPVVHEQVVVQYPRMTVQIIEQFKIRLYKSLPSIPDYQHRVYKQAVELGYTPLATGDKIWWKFPDINEELWGEFQLPDVLNKRMQRTAARVINDAMPKVRAQLVDSECVLVLQLHDALHALVREDRARHYAGVFKAGMDRELTWEGRSMPLVAEVKAGPSWGELKEIAAI